MTFTPNSRSKQYHNLLDNLFSEYTITGVFLCVHIFFVALVLKSCFIHENVRYHFAGDEFFFGFFENLPTTHTTLTQHWFNVDSTSWG